MFTPVSRARPLAFSRVAFLTFADDHGSFELIWNLSVSGSSRPFSQSVSQSARSVCAHRASPRKVYGDLDKKPRSRVRPRERERDGEGDEKGVVSSETLTERPFAEPGGE
jgi:hypothetical protein